MKIKIGSVDYAIKNVTKISDNINQVGQINYYENILIRKDIPYQEKLHTVMHEIVHALISHNNLNCLIKKGGKEDLTDGIARALLLFIRQNKEFVKKLVVEDIKL